jgi:hypothetical protein
MKRGIHLIEGHVGGILGIVVGSAMSGRRRKESEEFWPL